MDINFIKHDQKSLNKAIDTMVYFISEDNIDQFNWANIIDKDVYENFSFQGSYKEILELKFYKNFKRLILVGMGKIDFDNHYANKLYSLGGFVYDMVAKEDQITVEIMNLPNNSKVDVAKYLTQGMMLKSLSFTKYLSKHEESKLILINLVQDEVFDLTDQKALIDGVSLAKNLINEPANALYPESFIQIVKYSLAGRDIKISILDKEHLQKENMNAFLAVSKGSDNDPYVMVLEYMGNKNSNDVIGLVGKGVTFDSGGYSLKPAQGMMSMKTDMSGAASICGVVKSLALSNAQCNVVAIVGLVENLVNSNAMKPGDIIKSRAGKTIEILNTDAEGRLVLVDLLDYMQSKYKPNVIVDVATLTGAIIVSLGEEMAGLFSNNNELSNKLKSSGEKVGEYLWEMPLHESYGRYLKSNIADLPNVSLSPRCPGAIFAAMFLKEFVSIPMWAHIDIAGVAHTTSKTDISQFGATGFGVRLLNNFIKDYFQDVK